jgi:deoxyribodipyrimidine photolyase-related protein
MKILRLILGDQLNQKHSWFDHIDDDITYLMAEMRQETDYVKHHVQKVVAFFRSMRNFHEELSEKGHRFIYLKISETDNPQQLEKIIEKYVADTEAEKFEYQYPDEYRLDEQLKSICDSLSIDTEAVDSEHFYTTRYKLKNYFSNKK